MAWFSNAAQLQELGNNLANLHVKYDIIKYKNEELEDRIAELDSRLSALEIHKVVKRDDVPSDKFVESARKTYPITPSLYDESNIVTDANLISTVVINPYITDTDVTCQSTSATISTRDSSNSSSCISSISTDYSPPSSSSYDSGSSYSSSSDSGGSYD